MEIIFNLTMNKLIMNKYKNFYLLLWLNLFIFYFIMYKVKFID